MSRKTSIIVLVCAAILAVIIWYYYKPAASPASVPTPTPAVSEATSTRPSAAQLSGPSITVSVLPQNLSYGVAVNKYSNYRIQFNENCQGSPSSMSIKSGTAIMLDNRSGAGKWFTIGGARYYFNAYGFRVFVVKSTRLPRSVVIDCGTGKNSAVLTIQ